MKNIQMTCIVFALLSIALAIAAPLGGILLVIVTMVMTMILIWPELTESKPTDKVSKEN
ncbi:MAG: hypothetical protein JWL92_193 [Candidatus Nomurabacteria bacterium]|nr:hypothetical protein [Candidatus Nomurabacteria bacterium]